MDQVEGIAAAGIVDVEAAVVGHEPVVGGIVDAPKAERRAEFVAFGRVVVDHIQQHFDAGVVQAFDHGFEFGQIAAAQIARFRREEAQGVVTPVVAQATIREKPVIDEGMDRHQFDGGDAQRLQVFDDFRVSHSGEGTT